MAWGARSELKREADSPVRRAHPEAGDLIYAECLLMGYRGYDRSGTEPLFCFGHSPGYTDWTFETLAPMPKAIIA
jgi:beta-glucosidase